MKIFDRSHHLASLITGMFLLGASLTAQADDVQDANKLFKLGQHAQALNKVNGYLANKPKDAQARFLKGLILNEQDKVNDAIKIFSSLTEDYPELPEPYNNLAALYAKQGQYDKAKMALEMAIRTHPSYATAHENLGDIYAKMASQAYDRALQLDRGNAITQTKLSMIQDLFADSPRDKQSPARNSAPGKVEAAVPVVAAVTPAEKKEAPVSANNSGEVISAVNAWAAAWSSQNTKNYLASYASDFKTPDGESRTSWEATRRERVSAPKSISVTINNPIVTFQGSSHATVKFNQTYRASHLNAFGNKTLMMVKSGGKWLIQEEISK